MLSQAWANSVEELFDFNGKRKCDFPQQGSLEKGEKDGGAKQHIGRNVIDMYRSNAINVGRKSCTHKNA